MYLFRVLIQSPLENMVQIKALSSLSKMYIRKTVYDRKNAMKILLKCALNTSFNALRTAA